MSVEPIELMNEVWTRWQGHVIQDVFPLGRFLGCSDHSGVFQTKSAALGSSIVAVKLVPTDHGLAESQLPRWKRAGGIVHPHLLRVLHCGQCELDGLPYLYMVMEYADQTLAQLLQRRALTDDEAREMLRPILDVLAFLHSQGLVQGQLTPENILVVGDQLKLASDTIRRVGEGTMSANAPSSCDPPGARNGINSTAGDIWALGACLFEALTRRAPSVGGGRSEAVTLPADFSPVFRDVVARCLNPNPQKRPSATQLIAWASGQTESFAPEATVQPKEFRALESKTPEPPPRITPPPAAPEAARPAPPQSQSPPRRASLTALVGAVMFLALAWIGAQVLGSRGTATPPPALEPSLSQPLGAGAPVVADVPKPVAGESALHEVIPEVSQRARQTIRGHIKVRVRIVVDPDGSVIAATADRIGRSRYLSRLAVEAAKKWTFPPIETQSQRVLQLRFDFGRDDTTGRVLEQ